MFIVDDCSSFAHFQGSTPPHTGLEGWRGGGGEYSTLLLLGSTRRGKCCYGIWVCGWNPMVSPFKWNLLSRLPGTLHGTVWSGLEITAGQRTMSGLIGELTSQLFVLPVMLTGHNRSYWKWNQLFPFFNQYLASRCALRNFDLKSWVKYN